MQTPEMTRTWIALEDKLRAFILRRVGDTAVADDLLQELFIRIHDHLGELNDETRIRAWIYQVCRNLITDYHRKSRKEALTGTIPREPAEEEPGEDLLSETLDDMLGMMQDLAPEYREALRLTELEGMSQIEYARVAGISYSGAKSRVQRGRRMLKDLLMNCCHYEFDKYGTVISIRPVTCCCCCP